MYSAVCDVRCVRRVFMDDAQHITIIEIIAIEKNATPHRTKAFTIELTLLTACEFVGMSLFMFPCFHFHLFLSFRFARTDFFVLFQKLFLSPFTFRIRYSFGRENVWPWTSFPIYTNLDKVFIVCYVRFHHCLRNKDILILYSGFF